MFLHLRSAIKAVSITSGLIVGNLVISKIGNTIYNTTKYDLKANILNTSTASINAPIDIKSPKNNYILTISTGQQHGHMFFSEIDNNVTKHVKNELIKANGNNLHVIIHTTGGYVDDCKNICMLFYEYKKKYNATITVFVPYYAYSAGTVITLAIADKLYLGDNAKLGPIDVQRYYILNIPHHKYFKYLNLRYWYHIIMRSIENLDIELLLKMQSPRSNNNIDQIVQELTYGGRPHNDKLGADELMKIGIISDGKIECKINENNSLHINIC